MNGLLEYKSLTGGVKDIDVKNRIVTGYLADFDSVDHVNDVIERGAFKKSISDRGPENIYFLNNHKWEQPHGTFNVLEEQPKGLYFESTPLIDTTYSSDLMKLYEAGIVKEHSIGYQVMNKTNQKGLRMLKELKLFEGSNVTRGANPNTPFLGLKTLTLKEVNDQSKLILKSFRNGTFTDETFVLLEIALKQLQATAYELGKKSLKSEPQFSTPKSEPIAEIKTISNFIKNI